MTALLLANVGNSDLIVDGVSRDELPAEPRRLADRLRLEHDRYGPRIRLPILAKAVDYVLARGEPIDSIILFVSDQDPGLVPESEWLKDTCGLGELVKSRILEQYHAQKWTARQLRLHAIAGNPADYDTMLAYFERELPRIRSHYDAADLRVYLSLTGGTPAMNSMLLVVGNEVFGAQAVNLYDAKDRRQPFPLGVGRRLAARALRTALLANLQTYQYAAALAAFQVEGESLVDAHSSRRVLEAVLTYARDRLAFNLADAAQALESALPHAAGHLKERLLQWQDQVLEPHEAGRLGELYFRAHIQRLNHAYAEWVEGVFRFQESALRYVAQRHGAAFQDENLEYLDLAWIEAQPGLAGHLARAPRPGGGVGLNPAGSASRPLLRAILGFLGERGDDPLRSFVALSDRLDPLATLRNAWVHRSQGVRLADLERTFGDDPAAAEQVLADMLELATGEKLGANPYDAVNALCRQMLGLSHTAG